MVPFHQQLRWLQGIKSENEHDLFFLVFSLVVRSIVTKQFGFFIMLGLDGLELSVVVIDCSIESNGFFSNLIE